ncbi:hypothetical protein DPMN_068517 [Dreissena polymorpha]|uniref:Uncharacterized protein n=1 Tax=Dreissena polymorpha TaxID=45954 RepID=A0A9D3YZC0_DREPO|nr:hypothetical protein DPMN_068517 [Dreissena polymorpha]
MSDNFRAILGVLKNNDLVIKGSRVVKASSGRDVSASENDNLNSGNASNENFRGDNSRDPGDSQGNNGSALHGGNSDRRR